jgi:N-acetylmuramic acid 6-phosphate etherase
VTDAAQYGLWCAKKEGNGEKPANQSISADGAGRCFSCHPEGFFMATETVDPRFSDCDAWPLANAIEAMWEGQLSAVAAVRQALPEMTAATEAAALALGDTGRLVYVGAGTSGRVAIQDGAELTPTFDWPVERVAFAMAGGERALSASVEGAEDDIEAALRRMDELALTPSDVVIGVAASGTTPFTVAAVNRATELGAVTIGIANNAWTPLLTAARYPVLIPTGSELIAGSTRMKAGTAQKVVLNLISSGIMLRLGRVYRGMMVNMRLANRKLRARAETMVADLASCSPATAAKALAAADSDIKLAILIALGHGKEAAVLALQSAKGNLRQAIAIVACF